jgi:hypothetical protein
VKLNKNLRFTFIVCPWLVLCESRIEQVLRIKLKLRTFVITREKVSILFYSICSIYILFHRRDKNTFVSARKCTIWFDLMGFTSTLLLILRYELSGCCRIFVGLLFITSRVDLNLEYFWTRSYCDAASLKPHSVWNFGIVFKRPTESFFYKLCWKIL